MALKFGGQTPTQALHDLQFCKITAMGRCPGRSLISMALKEQLGMQILQPVHFSASTTGGGEEKVWNSAILAAPINWAADWY